MKRPVAQPTAPTAAENEARRPPQAFSAADAELTEAAFDTPMDADLIAPPPHRLGWFAKLAWACGGILVSAGIGLAIDRLLRDLFAAHLWLGYVGIAVTAAFILALAALVIREWLSLRRLEVLDALSRHASEAVATNDRDQAGRVVDHLLGIYGGRSDVARDRETVKDHLPHLFDGAEIVALAERNLIAPLDRRARALTATSARRVALVTAASPRALVDIAFVIWESVRLAGAIARLYGARPGLAGSWRLAGAILTHLAVTGGLVLTDGLVEQLVGQGLAAKLSARLGEGVVNGLMTVRVGIAAMRVVRPLPFDTQPQPTVRDFLPDLANLTREAAAK